MVLTFGISDMNQIKITFADTFDTAKRFWTSLLSKRYDVILTEDIPDLLIFGDSNFGQEHKQEKWKNVKKLFFTGENVRANWFDCDYACDFDFSESLQERVRPWHIRLPLYVMEIWSYSVDHGFDPEYLLKRPTLIDLEKEWEQKVNFCSFVQSNPNVPFRNQFFSWLDSIKKIDSGGPLFNNVGYVVDRPGGHMSKHDFIKTRMFNLAFENGSHDGYVTEKIINAFYANTIPIYWGSPSIKMEFNPNAFINVHEYIDGNMMYGDKLIERINSLVNHKERYLEMLSQPIILRNDYLNLDRYLNWFDEVVYKEIMSE